MKNVDVKICLSGCLWKIIIPIMYFPMKKWMLDGAMFDY